VGGGAHCRGGPHYRYRGARSGKIRIKKISFWSVISSQDDTFWLSYDIKSTILARLCNKIHTTSLIFCFLQICMGFIVCLFLIFSYNFKVQNNENISKKALELLIKHNTKEMCIINI
jgi:hypothetical protein